MARWGGQSHAEAGGLAEQMEPGRDIEQAPDAHSAVDHEAAQAVHTPLEA